MAINPYQVNDLMSNMFGSNSVPSAGTYASEYPAVPDNFNNNLSRYTRYMGIWTSTNWSADHTIGNAAWTQDVGNGYNGTPWRAYNSYYVRGVAWTNEANYWGYIGSMVGGYFTSTYYGFDSVGSNVDYDGSLLGHGNNVTYPFPQNQTTQFRDAANLPADGTSVVTSTGSAYTRSQYVPPSYFSLYITNGGTIGSGNVKFLVEQRPSYNAVQNSRTINSDAYGDIFTVTQARKLNRRRLSIMMSRIFSGANQTFYTFPLEEDGTNVGYAGTGHMNGAYHYSSISAVTGTPTSRPSGMGGDYRIRHHGMFPINEEYYGIVQGTKCGIMSNKCTTLPLIFFDLADTWTLKAGDITNVSLTTNVVTITCPNSFSIGDQVVVGGLTTATFLNGVQLQVASASGTQFTAAYTHADYPSAADTGTAVQLGARIAGVTVNQAKNKIYFLSERGDLAVYDFTVSGGAISALTAAPVLAAGEAYGALSLSSDGLKLYALNGSWAANPTQTTAGTGRIGVTAYTIGAGTWGAANNSALTGRHNARSLSEMITLRNGWLAMLVEKVVVTSSIVNADPTNIAWQLMVFDPSLATWNAAQIDASGAFLFGTGANKWAANVNASILDVATGKLLIQTNWLNNSIWVADVSGTAAGLTNADLTAVGKGQANDIFPVAVSAGAKVQIRKSQSHDRTIFWHSEANSFNATTIFYMAPPSFAWTSGTLSTISDNAQSGGITTTIDKDKLIHSNSAWGSNDEYSILGYFNESYVNLIIMGSVYNEYGIGINNFYGDHNTCSMVWVPTYYKTASALADSWSDASTNAYSVSAVPGTDVNICYGLKVQFTPAVGTTFNTGEFHNLNVSYGSIKYQRKSRFTWAMFAGQTFQATETKALSDVNAIKPTIIDGNHTVSVTGPTSVTGVTSYRTAAQWPKLVTGTPQNTPAVMEITFANSPNPSTLINVPGDGKAVTASNQVNGAASNAFSGNPNSYWRTNASGSQYIQINMGSSVTANSYSLRFNPSATNEAPASWTLKGSATGAFAGEDVTIDTQTIPAPLYNNHAFNVGTPGSYQYYRLTFASNGSNDIQVGSIRFFTAALTNSVNFAEIQFGNGWERGLTFEVDTGSGYTTILPLWRSQSGTIWCFARQTGAQKLRITVQSGANQLSGGNPNGNAVMGPYTLVDYGTQTQMNAARLGSAVALDGDPTRGSYDAECIGIAADAVSISIDGDSPMSRNPYGSGSMIASQLDWTTVAANQYKVHPFWGFVIFPGAGGSSAPSTQAGTNMTITYNWGRRV